MLKVLFFSRAAIKRATACFLQVFAVVGIVGLFVPLDNVFFVEVEIFYKILYVSLCLIIIYCIVYVGVNLLYFFIQLFCNKLEISELGNGKKLHILFGDILGDEITNKAERTNIVIPFNRFFDIKVDDSLISRKSLHGMLVEKLLSSDKYDEKLLGQTIRKALQRSSNHNYQKALVTNKDFGNKYIYPVGAVACLPGIHNEFYLCFGLSKFNQENAVTTQTEYIHALNHLVVRISELSQSYPVYIPLIGTGLSRLGLSYELALNILIQIIELHKSKITCDVYIVLKPELKYLIEKNRPNA